MQNVVPAQAVIAPATAQNGARAPAVVPVPAVVPPAAPLVAVVPEVVVAPAAVAAAPQVNAGPVVAPVVSADQLAAALEGAAAKKGKRCFRCGLTRQLLTDCPAPYCDFCEGPVHVGSDCPLLSTPKPQVRVYGYAHEELLFFKMPLTETYKAKLENVRLASVTVTGGDLTIPRIVSQLQRLVPSEQFIWYVKQVGHNIYKVQFPSRLDLERLKIFGACKVPNTSCELTVDSWANTPEPMETLPQVWVRVEGIPWIHRGEFLALWTVGDMFGMTLKIDMAYTRKHGVLRILIGCLNWSKIPKHFPIFIKDGFYNLTFLVDGEDNGEMIDVEMDDPTDDDDGNDDDEGDLGDDFKEALDKEQQQNGVSAAGETQNSVGGWEHNSMVEVQRGSSRL